MKIRQSRSNSDLYDGTESLGMTIKIRKTENDMPTIEA